MIAGPPERLMEGRLIDGKAFADRLCDNLVPQVAGFAARQGRPPGLAVVLVGDDPASHVYVRNKVARTQALGMRSVEHRLPAETTQAALLQLIAALNGDNSVDGILVQLPLPVQIDAAAVINAIAPAKDVDGFHIVNVGRLAAGFLDGPDAALVPCTPLGCSLLLKDRLGDLGGAEALVIGRSNIVGKPMAHLLLAENCTVQIAHSRSRDLAALTRRADIVVAAVGRPEMVRGDWIKPGATVIDVGINRVPAPEKGIDKLGNVKTRLVGDVAFDEAIDHVGGITPVPGGVGPMTIACLLRNTLTAAQRRMA